MRQMMTAIKELVEFASKVNAHALRDGSVSTVVGLALVRLKLLSDENILLCLEIYADLLLFQVAEERGMGHTAPT